MLLRQALPLAMLLSLHLPAAYGADRAVITSRAELEAHLQQAHENGSPLLYLSQPGRRYFLEHLLFTADEVIPVNHAPLQLELNAQQTREILALFGYERMATADTSTFEKISVRESRYLENYYELLREIEALRDAEGMTGTGGFRTELRALLEHRFGPQLDEAALPDHDPADVKLLYQAVSTVFFYTNSPALLRSYENLLAELLSRWPSGVDDSEFFEFAHTAYQDMLIAREFDRAERFAARYGIETARWQLDPKAASEGGMPTVLDVRSDADGVHLSRRVINVEEGSRIVAVVSQGCAFSRRAMEVVENDKRLRVLLGGRTEWVTDQRESQYVDAIALRNATAQETTMSIAYRESDWPEVIQFGQWPVFYFLKDGELQEKIVGWPHDEQADNIVEAIRRLEAGSEE